MRGRIPPQEQAQGPPARRRALAEVRALIGPRPDDGYRRDLLIEHLHRSTTASAACTTATWWRWRSEMNVPMAEVYEVATFYHHFEVLRGRRAAPRR